MLRLALILVALTSLSACNMLMTQQPVFSPADEKGAPAMRLGVWAGDPSADCKFDETQPLSSWPSCANGFVALPDGKLGAFNSQAGGNSQAAGAQADAKPTWQTTGYVLASGDPRVFQIHLTGDMGALPMPQIYVYAGLKPTKLDDQGRMIATESWPVQCGPPPPDNANPSDGSPQHLGTLHPLPGMKMDAQGTNCSATDPDAVRGAAKATRKWTKPTDISTSHWVRDGDK